MFSVTEKRQIAAAVEKALLDLKHPEMTEVNADFVLVVVGKEPWSFARIQPNWAVDAKLATEMANPWNERAREVMGQQPKEGDGK